MNKEEEDRKRRLQQLRDETYKLVTASDKYDDILKSLNDGLLNNKKASKDIQALYDDQLRATTRLKDAEEAYQKALAGGKTKKSIAELAQELRKAQKAVDDFKESSEKIDLSVFKEVQGDLNLFGLAAEEAGVKFDDLAKNIENAFKAGKISAADAAKQLKETKDILEGGIPGVTGDVEKAVRNVLSAGTKGGSVLLDAIKDVGVETQEKFLAGLNPQRAGQLQDLTKAVDESKGSLQDALSSGPGVGEGQNEFIQRTDTLKDKLEGAKKALEDFQDTIPTVQLADLKGYLLDAFDPGTVQKFMEALRENGIETVSDLTSASDDTLTYIAGSLQNLGLPFQETSDQVTQLLAKLDQLDGTTYKPKVELQVSSNFGDAVSQGIVQQIIDQGSSGSSSTFSGLGLSTDGPGTNNNGGGGGGKRRLTAAERADFETLRRKNRNHQTLTAAERDRLRDYNTIRGA